MIVTKPSELQTTRGIEKKKRYRTFGSVMPGRSFHSNSYRYGFNDKEKDDEIEGGGNAMDFGDRIEDTRIGRWMSIDADAARRPDLTPYRFGLNSPISFIDPNGRFEFDPALLAKYPKVRAALANLKTELQKPENATRLNNILKYGQYGSKDEFFELFEENNHNVKISSASMLSYDKNTNAFSGIIRMKWLLQV